MEMINMFKVIIFSFFFCNCDDKGDDDNNYDVDLDGR